MKVVDGGVHPVVILLGFARIEKPKEHTKPWKGGPKVK